MSTAAVSARNGAAAPARKSTGSAAQPRGYLAGLKYPTDIQTRTVLKTDNFEVKRSPNMRLVNSKSTYYMYVFLYGYFQTLNPKRWFLEEKGKGVRDILTGFQGAYIVWNDGVMDPTQQRCKRLLVKASEARDLDALFPRIASRLHKMVEEEQARLERGEFLVLGDGSTEVEFLQTQDFATQNANANEDEDETETDPASEEAESEAAEIAKFRESFIALLGHEPPSVVEEWEGLMVKWFNENLRELVNESAASPLNAFVQEQLAYVRRMSALVREINVSPTDAERMVQMARAVLSDTRDLLMDSEVMQQ